MKGKIFCLMGKSCSGKDTLFKLLCEDMSLGLTPIILYTTRPKREYEKDGDQYYFISKSKLEEYEALGLLIEKRAYNTVEGIWIYATIYDGQVDFKKGSYLLISTLEGYKKLKGHFGEEVLKAFYIEVEDGVRLERALKREQQQKKPNFNELCRRFLADDMDFSLFNRTEAGVKKVYDNFDLKSCYEEIRKDLLDTLRFE
jgi:guanylate kinase